MMISRAEKHSLRSGAPCSRASFRFPILPMLVLLAAGLGLLLPARAAAASRPVVSVVLASNRDFYRQALAGFKEYFGSRNIPVSFSEYALDLKDAATVFQNIADERPALILAVGEDALKSVRERTKGIPVVFCMVFNPREYIDGRSAGVSLDIPAETKLSHLQRILPSVRRYGLLYSDNSLDSFEETAAACRRLGLQLTSKKIATDKEFMSSLWNICLQSDCFLMVVDTKIYFSQTLKYLLLESLREKFPVVGLSTFHTKAGALVSFDCDFSDLGAQAAEIAASVLETGNMPEQRLHRPRKVKYSLNLVTAERLGTAFTSAVVRDAAAVVNKEDR